MTIRRCHAVILVADISSATRLGEIIDGEDLRIIIKEVLTIAEQTISKYKGVLNQLHGDGVLAAFGLPDPQEDAVYRAVQAALELHERLNDLSCRSLLPRSFTLRLHSGIHAGVVIMGEGNARQGTYALTGDALNTASRLSDKAAAGETIISAETLQGDLPFFNVEELAPLNLKGKLKPIAAYRILGRSEVTRRYQARVKLGLTQFVGRSAELKLLEEKWQNSQSGQFSLLNVVGDAGLGKTRLVEEFLRRVDAEPQQIFRCYCQKDGVPLEPFVQLLNRITAITQGMSRPERLKRIDKFINNIHPEDSSHLPATRETLQHLLTNPEAPASTYTSVQGAKIVRTIVECIYYYAQNTPAIVFVDDWHQSDELSRLVLQNFLLVNRALPWLVVTTSRNSSSGNFVFSGELLPLEPFTFSESTKIIDLLFPQKLTSSLSSSLHNNAGGNPLFLEELCKTLSRNPAMDIPRHFDIPSNLHSLISLRIATLSEYDQMLVKKAAVIGNVIDREIFQEVLGFVLTEHQLSNLAEQDVIYQTENDHLLRFKHGLTREAIYELINLEERVALHSKTAHLLIKKMESREQDDSLEQIAYHLKGAREYNQAGRYAELAGNKALSTSALDRARKHYIDALEMLDPMYGSVGNSADSSYENTDENPHCAYEKWSSILQRLGWTCVFDPSPEHLELLSRAIDLAADNNDLSGLIRAEYWAAYVNYALGISDKAIEHAQSAFTKAQQTKDSALIVKIHAVLAQSYAIACNYKKALEHFERIPSIKHPNSSQGPAAVGTAYAIASKAAVLGDQGYFQKAYNLFDQALTVMGGIEHEVEGSILALYSAVKLWQGRWNEAKNIAELAQKKAQRITSTYVYAMSSSLYGYADWKLNGSEKSAQTIVESTRWLESQQNRLFISLNYGWLSEIMLAQNRIDQVRIYAGRALAQARKKDRLGEAQACRSLAIVALLEKKNERVAKYLNLAFNSATARHSLHEKATTLLHQAQAADHHHEWNELKNILSQAKPLFVSLGMDWHQQRAQELLSHIHPTPNH